MWQDVREIALGIAEFVRAWEGVEFAFQLDWVGRPRESALGTGLVSGEL